MATPEAILNLYEANPTTELIGPFTEINQEFVLASGYLVFFMHCGFAMVRQLSSAKGSRMRAHPRLLVQPGDNTFCACSCPSDA